MSAYLQPDDYATYGLTDDQAANVASASAMIDTVLKRPEGLVWAPDFSGQPCYMAGLSAPYSLALATSIAPGLNVAATVTGPVSGLLPGDVLIVDRAANGGENAEALVLAQVQGANVVFRSVLANHSVSAVLEPSLTVTEQRFMPPNRPITMLAKHPVLRLVSGTGRYGYSRRGGQATSNMDDFNLLAALSHFGGPPVWEVFDPATADIDPMTGQCWVPAGVMLAYYTEVRLRYVAGYSQANIPEAVKQACAMLAQAMADAPSLGAVKSFKAGDTAITRFADTMVSGDVRNMLRPYMARVMA